MLKAHSKCRAILSADMRICVRFFCLFCGDNFSGFEMNHFSAAQAESINKEETQYFSIFQVFELHEGN